MSNPLIVQLDMAEFCEATLHFEERPMSDFTFWDIVRNLLTGHIAGEQSGTPGIDQSESVRLDGHLHHKHRRLAPRHCARMAHPVPSRCGRSFPHCPPHHKHRRPVPRHCVRMAHPVPNRCGRSLPLVYRHIRDHQEARPNKAQSSSMAASELPEHPACWA